MDKKDVVEQAYKNGYIEGIKKFAKRLKERSQSFLDGDPSVTGTEVVRAVTNQDLDKLVEELQNGDND